MVNEDQRVEQLVQYGISAAREGRLAVAQQSLREAVRLAPDHEQGWLWLSGVEQGDDLKIAALNQVLRINPGHLAARRGLEQLSQPKGFELRPMIDPAPQAGPAPTQPIGFELRPMGEPVLRAPAPVPSPPPAPALAPMSTTSINESPIALDQHVDPELLAELRPAIESASKKRPFWPRTSELIILAGLLVVMCVLLTFMRSSFQSQFSADPLAVLPTAEPAAQVAGATAAAQPTAAPAPVNVGQTFRSASYGIVVESASPDPDGKGMTVQLQLTNRGTRVARFRETDFSFRNARGQGLSLDAGGSSLLSNRAGTIGTIDPSGSTSGSLHLVGDVSQSPVKLTWQPTNGGVRIEIVVK